MEAAAAKVARQSVKVKADGHQVPPGGFFKWLYLSSKSPFWVQFINETDFPMKIILGREGWNKCNLAFQQDVQPRASFQDGVHFRNILSPMFSTCFSTGGYIIIYLNGVPSPNTEPPARQARVIEFALSSKGIPFVMPPKINIQDKTSDEFTRGLDTYNNMKCGEAKTLYWFENGKHFMARGEIVPLTVANTLWRFVIQDFDSCSMQDTLTA